MEILIHADGIVLSEEMKAAIEEKISHVEQYAPRAVRSRVNFRKTSAHPSVLQYQVRVVCEVPGRDLSAEELGPDPLSALEVAAGKIERQLRKRKTALLARRSKRPRAKKKTPTK